MTKEALKLALEALQPTPYKDDWTVAKETNKAITAIKEALANEALEKMAENARELGLDYEPAQRTWIKLTLDERIELAQDVDWAIGAYCEYAEKIEAKLKEKNT